MPHDIIKKYCDMLPNMVLVQNCYDAIEANEYLNSNRVDLIFLDLNMPKIKGFEFLKTLQNPPKIIVTTAYTEFALEGYELNIVDYLLKPFSFERFLKAINKAFLAPNTETPATVPVSTKNNSEVGKSIFFNSNKKHIQVQLADILYVEASGNNVTIVLKSDSITLRDKLSSVFQMLPKSDFVQVHRSFIVATKHVQIIEGNQIHIDQHTIPIGKLYRSNLKDILG
jgi:DNA-binding LytR/AlgR family response regulator